MNLSLTAVFAMMFSDGSDDEVPPAVMSESESGEAMGPDDSISLPAEIEEQSMDEDVGSEVDVDLPSDVEFSDVDEALEEQSDPRVPSPADVASWLRSPTGISSISVGMELYSPHESWQALVFSILPLEFSLSTSFTAGTCRRRTCKKSQSNCCSWGIISFCTYPRHVRCSVNCNGCGTVRKWTLPSGTLGGPRLLHSLNIACKQPVCN